jgi:hypothetical protein
VVGTRLCEVVPINLDLVRLSELVEEGLGLVVSLDELSTDTPVQLVELWISPFPLELDTPSEQSTVSFVSGILVVFITILVTVLLVGGVSVVLSGQLHQSVSQHEEPVALQPMNTEDNPKQLSIMREWVPSSGYSLFLRHLALGSSISHALLCTEQ